jgi:hypothetical protein
MFDPGRSEGLGSLQVVYCSAPLCNSIELTEVNEHGRKFKFSHQGELKVGVNHWLNTSLDFLKKSYRGCFLGQKFLVHPAEIWPKHVQLSVNCSARLSARLPIGLANSDDFGHLSNCPIFRKVSQIN